MSAQAFVEAEQWPADPPGVEEFERSLVREALATGLVPLVARMMTGDDHLALLKKVRDYVPRARDVLGDDAVRALVRETVLDADGDETGWAYVEAVLLPAAEAER